MKKSTYSRPSQSVSAVKKSQAIIVCACVRRNSRQHGRVRAPAGGTSACRRILATVVADLHAQTGKLPHDALVPPTGILTGETQNKLAQLVCHRRPTRAAPGIGPASPNKLAMPMQQGVWTDEERRPSPEEPASCSQKHTIGIL